MLRGCGGGPRHEAVVHHSSRGRFSLRQGKWKLELCPGSGANGASPPMIRRRWRWGCPTCNFYDMSHDDVEQVNVQDEDPEVVARLLSC